MDDCPSMYMADSLGKKEIKDVLRASKPIQKFKMNCLGLCYFLVQAEDIFDVLYYLYETEFIVVSSCKR